MRSLNRQHYCAAVYSAVPKTLVLLCSTPLPSTQPLFYTTALYTTSVLHLYPLHNPCSTPLPSTQPLFYTTALYTTSENGIVSDFTFFLTAQSFIENGNGQPSQPNCHYFVHLQLYINIQYNSIYKSM